MTTLDPKDGYATLINTFDVEPDRAEELVRVLHDASQVMSTLPGFVSANIHLSEDGRRVVNYAQWQTRADFDAAIASSQAQPHMKHAADLANSYEPLIYALKFSDELPPTP